MRRRDALTRRIDVLSTNPLDKTTDNGQIGLVGIV
jgi:hypothetical protein